MTTMLNRLAGFLVLAILTGPASLSFATTQRPTPVIEHAPGPVIARARQAQAPAPTYAAREIASASQVGKFQGGGTAVYIGGSTVVIVLLVVLIVLLI
jgi:hypothetical protein